MSIIEFVAALADDALSLQGVPGAGTLVEAIRQLRGRRLKEAYEVLLEEMRRGETLPVQAAAKDMLVAAIYRYGRSAREGTARRNLRLMARIMRNGTARPDFYADDFLRYAALIESLSRDEIALVALTYRHELSGPLHRQLESAGKDLEKQGVLSSNDVFTLKQTLLRTGLVTFGVVASSASFHSTKLLSELGRLAELEVFDLAED